MKTSEVLRRVRNHLKDGGYMLMHERYICFAIDHLYFFAKTIGDRDRTRLKRLIRTTLGGQSSLEAWLSEKHDIPITNTTAYNEKIMTTRKAWLTHLIEHYEAKGD